MKKKLLLIPITLTALTPMVSMVGCSDVADYQINLDDIETIIGLKDVKYLQIDGIYNQPSENININKYFSPTVFYSLEKNVESLFAQNKLPGYFEKYVYLVNNDQYFEKSRETDQDPFSSPEQVSEDWFLTPKYYGDVFLDQYNRFVDLGGTLIFDTNDRIYKGEAYENRDQAHIVVQFQFFQNKLIKCKYLKEHDTNIDDNKGCDYNLKYDEITPVVPD